MIPIVGAEAWKATVESSVLIQSQLPESGLAAAGSEREPAAYRLRFSGESDADPKSELGAHPKKPEESGAHLAQPRVYRFPPVASNETPLVAPGDYADARSDPPDPKSKP